MYANLTDTQKKRVMDEFDAVREQATDVGHAVAIAAFTLVKTHRGWNGKVGDNAFAAALAILVMSGHVELRG